VGLLSVDPTAAIVASVLMVLAGLVKRRIGWRAVECPVCHNEKQRCTCRWL
jgi:hypothetical protein